MNTTIRKYSLGRQRRGAEIEVDGKFMSGVSTAAPELVLMSSY